MAGRGGGLDPVSFLFGQVLTQIEYLHESGHLSQDNYATIVNALLQATPPSTPAASTPSVAHMPILEQEPQLTAEPSWYASVSTSSSSLSSSAAQPSGASSDNAAGKDSSNKGGPASFLKLRSKSSRSAASPISSSGSGSGSAPVRGPSAASSNLLKQQQQQQQEGEDAEEEGQLGAINKNIRRALQGGFLLSSVVDQALSVTPYFPGAVRERIVDRVSENSGEWVQKMTSPRRQAIARQNVARAGSSVLQVARGGGGTSRASRQSTNQSAPAPGAALSPIAGVDDETGTFTIVHGAAGQTGLGEPPFSMTSIHSFLASAEVQVTTVVTASFLKSVPADEDVKQLRQAGFLPEQVSDYEETSQTAPASRPYGQNKQDPSVFSGRDW